MKQLNEFFDGALSGDISFDDFKLTDEGLVDVSDFIDKEALELETFKISEPFIKEYRGTEKFIIKNTEIFTIIRDQMVQTGFNTADAAELEDYRMFPRGFMQKRGVFYCPNVSDLIPHYEILKHSDIYQITNDTYEERYMLPICLPNGHVFTHMGYCPPVVDNNAFKYILGNVEWIDQGNLLGHLESLRMYPGKTIYVCEGMMDAYRLSDIFNAPAIALLGANLSKTKRALLSMLKADGYTLIYVPDEDQAGLNKKILEDPFFSNIIRIDKNTKDFDILAKTRYIEYIQEHYEELKTDLPVEKVPAALIPLKARLEISNNIKNEVKYLRNQTLVPTPSANLFNAFMSGFSLCQGA